MFACCFTEASSSKSPGKSKLPTNPQLARNLVLGTWEANGHMIQHEDFLKRYLTSKADNTLNLVVSTKPMLKQDPLAPSSDIAGWPGWSAQTQTRLEILMMMMMDTDEMHLLVHIVFAGLLVRFCILLRTLVHSARLR